MANEKRLIDREQAKRATYEEIFWTESEQAVVRNFLARLPTVDAVEVVHGRWEQVQRWATKSKYRCSVCGREIMSAVKVNTEKYPYCHCGAKMDGGTDDGLL